VGAQNGGPSAENLTGLVFDEPLPEPAPDAKPVPPPAPDPAAPPAGQPAPPPAGPAALALLPEAAPEDTLAGGSTEPWQGKPDPAAAAPPALPAQAHLHLGGAEPPLLASLGGPFSLEHKGDRSAAAEHAGLGDEDERSPYSPLQIKDLRAGAVAWRFGWKAPVWARPRLSPDALYIIGPDNKPGCPATVKDGLLFVWKRETATPTGELKVPGPVTWLDFVANDQVAVLALADPPVLQVWDVAGAKLEKSVALPKGEFTAPAIDPFTLRPAPPDAKTYAPDPALGTVSPGGSFVALGGATAVHLVSLKDGKVAGSLRLPRKRFWPSGKPGNQRFEGLTFSADGGELYGLVQTERGWLLTWSMATGRPTSQTALDNKGFHGPPLPGPEPGTVLIPSWQFDPATVDKELRAPAGLPYYTAAVVDARNGAVLAPLPLFPLRRSGDGVLALNAMKFTPQLPPPFYVNQKTLSDDQKIRLGESRVLYVASLDREAIRRQQAAQPRDAARPSARPGDRAGLAGVKPAPPPAWTRPPAPPPPVAGLVGAFHVPNSPPLFGDVLVGFVSSYRELNDGKLIESLRPKAQTGNGEAAKQLYAAYKSAVGVHWHRYDLRTGKPAGPVIELWPWATSPVTGIAYDFGTAPSAAAMTRDGDRLALRDPADAARVDVWDASGARLLSLVPYDPGTPVQWVGWSQGGHLLTLGGGRLAGWDVPAGKPVFEVDGGYRLPVAPARGGGWVALHAGTHIDLLDGDAGSCRGRCPVAEGDCDPSRPMDLAVSPDADLLACLAWRRKPDAHGPAAVLAWDLATGQPLPLVPTQRGPGRALVALDGRRVLLDGIAVVDLKAPVEYAFYFTPSFRSFSDMPHPGGPLPGSPDGRAWSFGPEPGWEDPRVQRGTTEVMLRPLDLPGYDSGPTDAALVFSKKMPLTVVVDIGTEERSRQFGKNLVTFLQGEGYRIGKGGWKLHASCEVQPTEHYLTYKDGWGGFVNVPRIVVAWKLYAPGGELAHTTSVKSEFDQRSKYFQGTKVVGKQGPYTEIESTWEFPDKDPHEAMVEELLDGAARGGAVRLPGMLGKFQGKYQPLPVTTNAVFPPVAADSGK
jgi:hypothetical protein